MYKRPLNEAEVEEALRQERADGAPDISSFGEAELSRLFGPKSSARDAGRFGTRWPVTYGLLRPKAREFHLI